MIINNLSETKKIEIFARNEREGIRINSKRL